MIRYNERDKALLLTTPLQDILEYFGKEIRHTGRHYYSPFRDENTPSFHINPVSNTWYDFGTGEGGGVIDLVSRLAGCERREAYDVLAKMQRNFIPSADLAPQRTRRSNSQTRQIVIDRVRDEFKNRTLKNYLAERSISLETAQLWCKEVTYHLTTLPGRQFYGIGFKNDDGGYVLRSSSSKRCSSGGHTTLSCPEEGYRDTVSVFEGFMDFLSWFEYNGFTELPCDVCVLNSVVNVKNASVWLSSHQRIELYLDNDAAGRKATEDITMNCSSSSIEDMSGIYEGFKDFNAMLQGY